MEEYEKTLKYVLNILNRKDYTEFELRNKLETKNFDAEVVSNVISHLRNKNFINDERYVENYIYFRLNAGYGKFKIRYELKSRGIDEELIDKHLNTACEKESAERLFESRYNSFRNKKNGKIKMFSFFERRGYSYETINELLENKKGLI